RGRRAQALGRHGTHTCQRAGRPRAPAFRGDWLMKALIRLVVAGFAGIATAAAYAADESSLSFGGDEYLGGQHVSISQPVAHDAFAAGYDAAVAAPVTGNAHLAGYNVSVTSDVGGDLYAAGFSVVVT